MYSTSEIVENIMHNIKLQKKLCEKVVEEHRCFTADTLDDPDEIIREQIWLENEIRKPLTHDYLINTVKSLFP